MASTRKYKESIDSLVQRIDAVTNWNVESSSTFGEYNGLSDLTTSHVLKSNVLNEEMFNHNESSEKKKYGERIEWVQTTKREIERHIEMIKQKITVQKSMQLSNNNERNKQQRNLYMQQLDRYLDHHALEVSRTLRILQRNKAVVDDVNTQFMSLSAQVQALNGPTWHSARLEIEQSLFKVIDERIELPRLDPFNQIRCEELENKIAMLQADLDANSSSTINHKFEVQCKKVKELELELSQLDDQLRTIIAERDSLQSRMAEMEATVSAAQQHRKDAVDLLEQAHRSTEDGRQRQHELEKDIRDAQTEITALRERLAHQQMFHKQEIDALNLKNVELQRKADFEVNTLESQRIAAEERCESVVSTNEQLTIELRRLAERIKTSEENFQQSLSTQMQSEQQKLTMAAKYALSMMLHKMESKWHIFYSLISGTESKPDSPSPAEPLDAIHKLPDMLHNTLEAALHRFELHCSQAEKMLRATRALHAGQSSELASQSARSQLQTQHEQHLLAMAMLRKEHDDEKMRLKQRIDQMTLELEKLHLFSEQRSSNVTASHTKSILTTASNDAESISSKLLDAQALASEQANTITRLQNELVEARGKSLQVTQLADTAIAAENASLKEEILHLRQQNENYQLQLFSRSNHDGNSHPRINTSLEISTPPISNVHSPRSLSSPLNQQSFYVAEQLKEQAELVISLEKMGARHSEELRQTIKGLQNAHRNELEILKHHHLEQLKVTQDQMQAAHEKDIQHVNQLSDIRAAELSSQLSQSKQTCDLLKKDLAASHRMVEELRQSLTALKSEHESLVAALSHEKFQAQVRNNVHQVAAMAGSIDSLRNQLNQVKKNQASEIAKRLNEWQQLRNREHLDLKTLLELRTDNLRVQFMKVLELLCPACRKRASPLRLTISRLSQGFRLTIQTVNERVLERIFADQFPSGSEYLDSTLSVSGFLEKSSPFFRASIEHNLNTDANAGAGSMVSPSGDGGGGGGGGGVANSSHQPLESTTFSSPRPSRSPDVLQTYLDAYRSTPSG